MKNKTLFVSLMSLLFLVGCEATTPVSCPNIETPDGLYPFKSNDLIRLEAGGIKISDDFKIAPSDKQANPFMDYGEVFCEQGAEAGQNVNHIYCDQLTIEKLTTNDAGQIIEEQLIGVEFVFDNSSLVEYSCFQ